jgi:hypothetical protein
MKQLFQLFFTIAFVGLGGICCYGMYDTLHTAKLDEPLTNGVFIKMIFAMTGIICGFIIIFYPPEIFED